MNDLTKKTIGERINAALAASETKQKELAKAVGVSDNIVSYWCSGARTPNTEQIIQIAMQLNVSADYLIGLSECDSQDIEIQAICKTTGLSRKAVETLLVWTENKEVFYDDIKALSFMLEQEEYNTLFALCPERVINGDIEIDNYSILDSITKYLTLKNIRDERFSITMSGNLLRDDEQWNANSFEDSFTIQGVSSAAIINQALQNEIIDRIKIAKKYYTEKQGVTPNGNSDEA